MTRLPTRFPRGILPLFKETEVVRVGSFFLGPCPFILVFVGSPKVSVEFRREVDKDFVPCLSK